MHCLLGCYLFNIQKIATGYGDDYTTWWLLDYPHVKENYNLIETDLRKQQALDTASEAIPQINFTGNLAWNSIANTTMFFVIEEAK